MGLPNCVMGRMGSIGSSFESESPRVSVYLVLMSPQLLHLDPTKTTGPYRRTLILSPPIFDASTVHRLAVLDLVFCTG